MAAAVRFVLLQPRIAENVGAAARALKNFGWGDWSIVDPVMADWAAAQRMAVQSQDVLESAQRPGSLEEAIADCVWVVGTSSRRRRGQRSLSPRAFAQLAAEQSARGPIALVFGDERSGLTNEALERCHDVSRVPTDPAQPSINLAQAVLLYAYECRCAFTDKQGLAPPAEPTRATDGEVSEVGQSLRSALTAGRFLRDERQQALHELVAPLVRSQLSRQEARLWTAALRSLVKALIPE
jgi:TrmH family RNA methyltransferase